MGNLKVLSGHEVCKILESQGYSEVRRRKGSHIILQIKHGNTTRTIPIPDHKELATGTLLSIIRRSCLSKELFESD
jgi:predicted RNA binding protein YcfA (HicA-like mRNA interferase family)